MERPHSSTQELDQLAQAMQHMREQLDGKAYAESYTQALAHELKSPLTAVQAHAELLQDHASPAQANSATRVLEQTNRMRDMLDKMLTLTKLERQESSDTKEAHLALALLQLTVQSQTAFAEQRQVALEVKTDAASAENFATIKVLADAPLFQLALANLIRNALEFSPRGGKVVCSLKQGQDQVHFQVQDQGPGLDPMAQDKLFRRYFSTARPGTGERSTGLGLALSQQIARLHQGEVSISSTKPGCLAEITVPIA